MYPADCFGTSNSFCPSLLSISVLSSENATINPINKIIIFFSLDFIFLFTYFFVIIYFNDTLFYKYLIQTETLTFLDINLEFSMFYLKYKVV